MRVRHPVLLLFWLLLPLAAGLRSPTLRAPHSERDARRPASSARRSAAIAAVAAVTTAAAANAADDGVLGAVQGVVESMGRPALEIQYDGPYMDRDTGTLRYPISGVEPADPVSTALLLLGAGATRFGGILPDEMPFNIVQKFLRGIGIPIFDLADDDFRKEFQDTWYGTNEQANLPAFMRSRRGGQPMADASEVDGAGDQLESDALEPPAR